MINITTFLDANACRLDKPVYYSIDREKDITPETY